MRIPMTVEGRRGTLDAVRSTCRAAAYLNLSDRCLRLLARRFFAVSERPAQRDTLFGTGVGRLTTVLCYHCYSRSLFKHRGDLTVEPLAQLDGGLEEAPAGHRGVQVPVIPGGPTFESRVDV